MGERGLRGAAGAVQQNREIRGSLGNTKIETPTYGLKGKSTVQNGKFKCVANFNSKLPILQIVMIDFQSVFNDMGTARLPTRRVN